MKKLLLITITTIVIFSLLTNIQFRQNNVLNYTNTDSLVSLQTPNRIIQNMKIQSNTVPNPPTGLSTHGSILIMSDSQIVSNVNSGTGTLSDPYIISGWNISVYNNYEIAILNVDKAITIENCYLNSEMYLQSTSIILTNDTNVKILNNYIENTEQGIDLVGTGGSLSRNIIISGNTILTKTYGINTLALSNSQISNNIISGLKYGGYSGINSEADTNITFTNNKFYDSFNGIYIYGDIQSNFQTNTFANDNLGLNVNGAINCTYNNNTMTHTNTGIFLQDQNGKVSNNKFYSPVIGISLTGPGENVVEGNYINSSTDTGIEAFNSPNGGTISNNTIVNPYNNGIKLQSSFNYKVTGNNIVGSLFTTVANILLNESNKNVVLNNILQESPLLLELSYSNLNNVSGNIFLDSYGNASLILGSNFNVIAKSLFNGSAEFDLILMNGSNNKIIENTFKQATFYNLFLLNENGASVEGNYFLTTPTFGFSQALDSGKSSIFLYNYWAGWTTPDQNHDGIVDYPYTIDGLDHSYDLKPLASNSESLVTFLQPPSASTTSNPINTSVPTSNSLAGTSPDFQLLAIVGGACLVVGIVIPVAIRKIRK